MQKIYLIFVMLLPLAVFGQQKWEAGAFVGFANYQGDLSATNIEFNETKPSFGLFARYHVSNKAKIRGIANFGFIQGTDANDEGGDLESRGWSFESNIFELSVVGEFHPFGKPHISESGLFQRYFSPYVFAGVGMVNSDPTVSVTKQSESGLFPEADFKSTTLTIPLGIGIQTQLSEKVSLGAEYGWRPTADDYLDGVSELGNPDGKDNYMFFGLNLSVHFGKSVVGSNSDF